MNNTFFRFLRTIGPRGQIIAVLAFTIIVIWFGSGAL